MQYHSGFEAFFEVNKLCIAVNKCELQLKTVGIVRIDIVLQGLITLWRHIYYKVEVRIS